VLPYFETLDVLLCLANVGTLMGLTNTIATFPGFIGPAVVGAITYKNVSVISSQTNFLIN